MVFVRVCDSVLQFVCLSVCIGVCHRQCMFQCIFQFVLQCVSEGGLSQGRTFSRISFWKDSLRVYDSVLQCVFECT